MLEPGVDEAVDLAERAAHRFADLLASAPDRDSKVPGMDWTVSDVGAHVLAGTRIYERLPAGGEPPWSDLHRGPQHNAEIITKVELRDPAEQAVAIHAHAAVFAGAYREHGTGDVVWNGGVRVPAPAVAAVFANECLIHGLDLARALKRPWPIPDVESMIAIRGMFSVLPHFVADSAAAFRGSYVIRFRGGPAVRLAFDSGTLTLTEDDDRADCRIWAAPTAFNLTGYGRQPLWKSIASGGLVAYGRKTWLGFKFPSLLRDP